MKEPEYDLEDLFAADPTLWDRLMSDRAFRAKIDAVLAKAEARGGATPHEEVMAGLRARYGKKSDSH